MIDWRDEVKDPEEGKVFEALADPKWDFRTIEGLSQETKLPEARVSEIILKFGHLTRKSRIPDKQGRELYTLRDKQSLMFKLKTFITKDMS